jgi:hypothetical protein
VCGFFFVVHNVVPGSERRRGTGGGGWGDGGGSPLWFFVFCPLGGQGGRRTLPCVPARPLFKGTRSSFTHVFCVQLFVCVWLCAGAFALACLNMRPGRLGRSVSRFCLDFLCLAAPPPTHHTPQFGKKYGSSQEEASRFTIFQQNLARAAALTEQARAAGLDTVHGGERGVGDLWGWWFFVVVVVRVIVVTVPWLYRTRCTHGPAPTRVCFLRVCCAYRVITLVAVLLRTRVHVWCGARLRRWYLLLWWALPLQ